MAKINKPVLLFMLVVVFLLLVSLPVACGFSKASPKASASTASSGSLLQSTDARTLEIQKSLAVLTQSNLSQSGEIKAQLKAIDAKLADIQNRLKVIEEKVK